MDKGVLGATDSNGSEKNSMCVYVWLSVYMYQGKERQREGRGKIKQVCVSLIFRESAEEYTDFFKLFFYLFYTYEINSKSKVER